MSFAFVVVYENSDLIWRKISQSFCSQFMDVQIMILWTTRGVIPLLNIFSPSSLLTCMTQQQRRRKARRFNNFVVYVFTTPLQDKPQPQLIEDQNATRATGQESQPGPSTSSNRCVWRDFHSAGTAPPSSPIYDQHQNTTDKYLGS